MVREREVKRVVQKLNFDRQKVDKIQWEQEARLEFAQNVGVLMVIYAKKVEDCRNGNRRRITPETVNIAFAKLMKSIIVGEEE